MVRADRSKRRQLHSCLSILFILAFSNFCVGHDIVVFAACVFRCVVDGAFTDFTNEATERGKPFGLSLGSLSRCCMIDNKCVEYTTFSTEGLKLLLLLFLLLLLPLPLLCIPKGETLLTCTHARTSLLYILYSSSQKQKTFQFLFVKSTSKDPASIAPAWISCFLTTVILVFVLNATLLFVSALI